MQLCQFKEIKPTVVNLNFTYKNDFTTKFPIKPRTLLTNDVVLPRIRFSQFELVYLGHRQSQMHGLGSSPASYEHDTWEWIHSSVKIMMQWSFKWPSVSVLMALVFFSLLSAGWTAWVGLSTFWGLFVTVGLLCLVRFSSRHGLISIKNNGII